MKNLSLFTAALSLSLLVACAGNQTNDNGEDENNGIDSVDATLESNDASYMEEEPTLEEEVFGVGVED